ncbi:beta-lactamase family protein [Nocardia otitidiscaviarum]|uniref:serine hydrolase domain-containing protein n=1 Tax=Nocardia otitidiscaviarum TaxID=1823 RepID=UPI0004A70FC8|nr:serine hydrolase domain-containing protein [Nocardia otitidiscaviarum]MBF6133626.1 beta-lactamase family protein [Nocardia otitidiscaviarum]MBF6487654.1 beta-lactamase family protein [Nocardia otitidiscaviarum]
MSETAQKLSEFVAVSAERSGVPGIAVGVSACGREDFACYGVTSVDNPLPVDQDTMFAVGSVSKTFTATALMRLVAEGRVELDAPVRRYVPEFAPTDAVADAITVMRLLNHTAGLEWKLGVDTGEGDDALARHTVKLAESPLIAQPGTRASYSQEGFNLAGRVIENVTGSTFEGAIGSLLLEPLGLAHSHYMVNAAMTRRFAVGHNVDADGALTVARQWKDNRSNNPGGGMATSVRDLLGWARFHLGDGRTETGERILPPELLHRMRQQTVELRGTTLGDAFGICWFLREVDGVATIGHGGSGNGQFADLLIVPERNFAVVVMSNAGPDAGLVFNRDLVNWVLEHYLGVVERDPEPLPYDQARAAEIIGYYENEMMRLTLTAEGTAVTIGCAIKPDVRAATDTEMPPDLPPAILGLLPGGADEYIVTEGGLRGQRGFFTRAESGAVTGIDLAGRLFARVG